MQHQSNELLIYWRHHLYHQIMNVSYQGNDLSFGGTQGDIEYLGANGWTSHEIYIRMMLTACAMNHHADGEVKSNLLHCRLMSRWPKESKLFQDPYIEPCCSGKQKKMLLQPSHVLTVNGNGNSLSIKSLNPQALHRTSNIKHQTRLPPARPESTIYNTQPRQIYSCIFLLGQIYLCIFHFFHPHHMVVSSSTTA
jgi:hypothetical protein